jgi:predicted acetyltransferase
MQQREVELTRLDDDLVPAFRATFDGVFGHAPSEDGLERFRWTAEHDRFLAARSGDEVVGTAGAFTFEMSMPWAPPAGCAGITVVSVRADHRRRGLLTRMMHQLLDDASERGEPFAALWASEGPIYGRFGFGPAVPVASVRIQRDRARLRVPADPRQVALVGAEEAARRFPAIYDAFRATRHGVMARNDAWWRRQLADPPAHRDGAGEQRHAVLGDRGYALHRLRPKWEDGVPQGTVEVRELVATDAEAYRSLWRFVIDTDLAATTSADNIPVDDPITVLLDDPMRGAVAAGWPLYVRLVDVPAALSARGYRVDDTLTLRVHDAMRPGNGGTWRLSVSDGQATCERVDGPAGGRPDLELDTVTLATVALGGVRVTSLAAGGAIEAGTPDAVTRFERLLATDVAPWHGFMF